MDSTDMDGYVVRALTMDECEAIGFDGTLRTTHGPAFLMVHPEDDPGRIRETVFSVPMTCLVHVEAGTVQCIHLLPAAGDPGYFGPSCTVHVSSGNEQTDSNNAEPIENGSWEGHNLDNLPPGIVWEG